MNGPSPLLAAERLFVRGTPLLFAASLLLGIFVIVPTAAATCSDTTAPSSSMTWTPSSDPLSSSPGWWNLWTGSPTLSITGSDPSPSCDSTPGLVHGIEWCIDNDNNGFKACTESARTYNTYSKTLATPDLSYSRNEVWWRAVDGNNNHEGWHYQWIDIDFGNPSVSATGTCPASPAWCTTTSVTFSFSATDSVSGVKTKTCSFDTGSMNCAGETRTVAQGPHHSEIYGQDNAANYADVKYNFQVDTVDPTASDTIQSGTVGQAGWYTSAVTVRVTGSDASSGVNRIEYRINGGGWQSTTSNPADIPLNVQGANTLDYRAVDNVGRTSSQGTRSVSIDTVAAGVSGQTTTSPNGNGWFNTCVSVAITGSDATSGVAKNSYRINGGGWTDSTSNPVTTPPICTERSNNVVDYTSTDVAGSTGGQGSTPFNVDRTLPVSSVTTPSQWYNIGFQSVQTSDSDGLSGIAGCEFKITSAGTTTVDWTPRDCGGTIGFNTGGGECPSQGFNCVIKVRSTDIASNVATIFSRTFGVDWTPPAPRVSSPTTWQRAGFTATVVDDDQGLSGAVSCSVDIFSNGAFIRSAPRSCDGGFALSVGPGSDCRDQGANTCHVVLHATDRTGNTGVGAADFSIDWTKPVVAITGPPEGAAPGADFQVGISENDLPGNGGGLVDCRYKVELLSPQGIEVGRADSARTCGQGVTIRTGPTGDCIRPYPIQCRVTVWAVDAAGNVANAQARDYSWKPRATLPGAFAAGSDSVYFHFGFPGATASVASPEGYVMTVTYQPGLITTAAVARVSLDGVVLSARGAYGGSVPTAAFVVACSVNGAAGGRLDGQPCLRGTAMDGSWEIQPAGNDAGRPAGSRLEIGGLVFDDSASGDLRTTGTGHDARYENAWTRTWNWHKQAEAHQTTYTACSFACPTGGPPPEDLRYTRIFV